jgi:uncharacterized protein (DUF736 family)
MSQLGQLTPSSPGDLAHLTGYVQTLDGRLAIAIYGDPTRCDQERPSHRIITRARDGSRVEIGVAWLKTARHGPKKGSRFFSIQIDHPERAAPINVAASFDENGGAWSIMWRRRGAQSPASATTAM